MKKWIFNALRFGCIFVIIFFLIQGAVQYIWVNNERETRSLKEAYEFYEDSVGNIDVCFVGSSPMHAGISPIVVWGEKGITSINVSMSLNTAMLSYFQVKTLLDIQTPKVVVVDLASLFQSRKADEEMYEQSYKKMVDIEPLLKNKLHLINTILAENDEQQALYYYLPFFQHHSQWSQIRPSTIKTVLKKSPSYLRGEYLNTSDYSPAKLPDGYLDKVKTGNIDEYSLSYYEKLFNLCHEKNIEVLAINMPKNEMSFSGRRVELMIEVCEKNDVDFIDFNSDQELEKIDFNIEKDYYDQGHMRVRGNFKFSKILAQKLADMYGLEDHRKNSVYINWQQDYIHFCNDYKDFIESLPNWNF